MSHASSTLRFSHYEAPGESAEIAMCRVGTAERTSGRLSTLAGRGFSLELHPKEYSDDPATDSSTQHAERVSSSCLDQRLRSIGLLQG